MNMFNTKNPFKESDSYFAEILERPDQGYLGGTLEAEPGPKWYPPIDILDNKSEYFFEIDLPGLKKDEVHIVRERDILYVSGDRNLEKDQAKQKSLRQERPHGYFVRRFALPEDASRKLIKATLGEGVLQIVVCKLHPSGREKEYPQRLEVEVD